MGIKMEEAEILLQGIPTKPAAPGTVFAFRQSADKENTYELYIYDNITKYGDFNWETWSYQDAETSAKHIRDIIGGIPEGAALDIHINSNGGDAYEAVAIYNLLNQYKGYKTSYVDGVAHSAAFIIPFACDWRVMGKGTAALFHNMWSYVAGNAKELRLAADRLDKLMESNRSIYAQRAVGLTEEQIAEMMDNETMLTPEDCLKYGFCDEVTGYIPHDGQQASAQQETKSQPAQKNITTGGAYQADAPHISGDGQPPAGQKKREAGQELLSFAEAFLHVSGCR